MPAPFGGLARFLFWHLCKSLTINGVWGPALKSLNINKLRTQK